MLILIRVNRERMDFKDQKVIVETQDQWVHQDFLDLVVHLVFQGILDQVDQKGNL